MSLRKFVCAHYCHKIKSDPFFLYPQKFMPQRNKERERRERERKFVSLKVL